MREVGVDAASTGGVVGYARMCMIKYCHNDSSVVVGRNNVGGVIGRHYTTVVKDSIKNCYTIGGIVKDNVTAETNADYYVGGVIGYKQGALVTNCYNEGTEVTSWANRVGGVIGYSSNEGSGVYRCYNTGNVRGRHIVAGVVQSGHTGTGQFLFNKGDVTAFNGTAYGICGYEGYMNYCFNIGNVTGNNAFAMGENAYYRVLLCF